MGFPGDSDGKEFTCNAGDQVQSLGWEDPLEKEMATHSSVLAWEFHGQKSLEGSQRVKYGLSDQNFTVNHIYKSNKFVGFIVYSITINYIY